MSYLTDALRTLAAGGHVPDERDLFEAVARELEKRDNQVADLIATIARRDGVPASVVRISQGVNIPQVYRCQSPSCPCREHRGGRP